MKKLSHPSNWEKNEMAGEDWLKGFRRRNDNLSLRQPESASRARAMAFNKINVNAFFENVKQVLNSDENISPRSVWNLNETGLTIATKSAQVLAKKGSKLVGRTSSTELGENIFLLFFIFISIFILLTRRKATEALIHRVSNYPDLLPEMPRYCCPLVI